MIINRSLLIFSLGIISSHFANAQWTVEDPAAITALNALLIGQQKEQAIQEKRHTERINVQLLQHSETLEKWNMNLQKLKESWKTLNETRRLIVRQLNFIENIKSATGDPVKMVNLSLNKINREIFSSNGMVDHISRWLERATKFSDWGTVLKSLFDDIDTRDFKNKQLRQYLRNHRTARLRRRETLEKMYKEAESLRFEARTIQQKLGDFLQEARMNLSATNTLTGMQKLGLEVSVTEKGMRSAMEILEDSAKRIMEFKTFADNRDAITDQIEMHVKNAEHEEAAQKASESAKKIYIESRREQPKVRLSGGISANSKGKIRSRIFSRVDMPLK